MWPFGKKYPELTKLDDLPEAWSVATVQYGGAPLIVRKNTGCSDWAGHPQLSIKIGFAIPLMKQIPGGLPDPAENQELTIVEDIIEEKTKSATKCIFALVLTTGTMKELVFYVSDGSVIADLHRGLQQVIKSHEIQCMAVVEKDWKTYRSF
jgi:hypothetical protein